VTVKKKPKISLKVTFFIFLFYNKDRESTI